jgi:hypothetical protein
MMRAFERYVGRTIPVLAFGAAAGVPMPSAAQEAAFIDADLPIAPQPTGDEPAAVAVTQ